MKRTSVTIALAVAIAAPLVSAQSRPTSEPARQGAEATPAASVLKINFDRRPPLITPQTESAKLQAAVSLGDWAAVKTSLSELSDADARLVHARILLTLTSRPAAPDALPLSSEDVIRLANVLPDRIEISPAHAKLVGRLLARSLSEGFPIADAKKALDTTGERFDRFTVAQFWTEAGVPQEAAALLPRPNELKTPPSPVQAGVLAAAWANDPDRSSAYALLASASAKTTHAAEREELLAQFVNLAVLNDEAAVAIHSAEATFRSAPALQAALVRIALANADEPSAQRLARLAFQKELTGMLLTDDASRPPVSVLFTLIRPWLAEASAASRPAPATPPNDPGRRPTTPEDGSVIDRLRALAPTETSITALTPAEQKLVLTTLLRLHLAAGDTDSAVRTLQSLARTGSIPANDLASDILAAWAKPRTMSRPATVNSSGRPVPLAPSPFPVAQALIIRRLDELAALRAAMTAATGTPPPAEALVKALTAIQGQSAYIDPAKLVAVFGPADQINASTLIALADLYRASFARGGLPAITAAVTERSELTRSYDILCDFLARRAGDWRVDALRAGVLADASRVLGLSAEQAKAIRDQSFALYAAAAGVLAKQPAGDLDVDTASKLYLGWFTSAFGADAIRNLSSESKPSGAQIAVIRHSLDALPPPVRGPVATRLAGQLTDELRGAKIEIKASLIRAAADILGDARGAETLRRVTSNYDDLLAEVKLVFSVDGRPSVGKRPFGLKVALEHSRALDHDVNGFSRVLSGSAAGNTSLTGRMDYRASIETDIRQSLGDGFAIDSIVWASQPTTLTTDNPEWTQTPLAYVTLRAKDVAVDAVPPVRINMDFADQTGSVSLPITSEAVAIDAKNASDRPFVLQQVTQTLSPEVNARGLRTIDVEIKGQGLPPDVESILKLPDSDGWDVMSAQETNALVGRYDTTARPPSAQATRTWRVDIVGESEAIPFFELRDPTAASAVQQVKQVFTTDGVQTVTGPTYALPSPKPTPWWIVPLVLIAVVPLAAFVLFRRARRSTSESATDVSAVAPPRSAIAAEVYLRQVRQSLTCQELQAIEQTRQVISEGYAPGASSEKQTFDIDDLIRPKNGPGKQDFN